MAINGQVAINGQIFIEQLTNLFENRVYRHKIGAQTAMAWEQNIVTAFNL